MFLACLSIFIGFVLSMLWRRAYWDELFLRFGGLGFRVVWLFSFGTWRLLVSCWKLGAVEFREGSSTPQQPAIFTVPVQSPGGHLVILYYPFLGF